MRARSIDSLECLSCSVRLHDISVLCNSFLTHQIFIFRFAAQARSRKIHVDRLALHNCFSFLSFLSLSLACQTASRWIFTSPGCCARPCHVQKAMLLLQQCITYVSFLACLTWATSSEPTRIDRYTKDWSDHRYVHREDIVNGALSEITWSTSEQSPLGMADCRHHIAKRRDEQIKGHPSRISDEWSRSRETEDALF